MDGVAAETQETQETQGNSGNSGNSGTDGTFPHFYACEEPSGETGDGREVSPHSGNPQTFKHIENVPSVSEFSEFQVNSTAPKLLV